MAGNDTEDPVWLLLILLVIFAGIGWLIWYVFRVELLELMRYLRIVELAPLALFNDRASACIDWLRIAPVGQDIPSSDVLVAAADCFGVDWLRRLSAEAAPQYYSISPKSIGALAKITGHYWRWVVIAGCGGFVYYMLYVSDRVKFKTRYTLESFIKTQAMMWPVLAPIVDFNPSKSSARVLGSTLPDKLPPFAEALSPEEWLSFNRIPVVNGIPERERLRRALMSQLGPRWQGYKDLPLHVTLLFAAFALKGAQKRDESDDFLGRISSCWTKEGGFRPAPALVAEARKILDDPEVGGLALAVADKHAFRTTALLGVLKWARYMGGVLASAQFLWVRGVDRTLWYAANNLGRRSFHSEGAGALAHFMAEEAAKKGLPIPRLDTAIITINKYLADNQPSIPPREEPGKAKA